MLIIRIISRISTLPSKFQSEHSSQSFESIQLTINTISRMVTSPSPSTSSADRLVLPLWSSSKDTSYTAASTGASLTASTVSVTSAVALSSPSDTLNIKLSNPLKDPKGWQKCIKELFEKINIQLIKQKYDFQSKIKLKNYYLDLNSRTITKNNQSLKLTQKEIDIILFLNGYEKPQKVNVLQNKVWGYSLELETHTVETHIYRLRKKIKDEFKDNNFILSNDDGYFIEWKKKI